MRISFPAVLLRLVNGQLQADVDVLSEFKYEPSVKATDIGVLIKDGTHLSAGSLSPGPTC